jgi:hypothetical protein
MSVCVAERTTSAPPWHRKRTGAQFELTDLKITLSPALDRYGRRRSEQFEARLWGCSEILCTSRQPLLDVARILLSQGMSPQTEIGLVHAGNDMNIALRAPIGIAAQFDVMGCRFIRRKAGRTTMPGLLAALDAPLDVDYTQSAGMAQRARHKANPKQELGSRLKSSRTNRASKGLRRSG